MERYYFRLRDFFWLDKNEYFCFHAEKIYDKMSKNLESKDLANIYKVIDEKIWERTMHCMIFKNSVEPAFCVTFEADITNFLQQVRKQSFSFTLAFVYAVCKCAHEIEAF